MDVATPEMTETPVQASDCSRARKAFLMAFVLTSLVFPFTLRGMGDATVGLVDLLVIPRYQKVADAFRTPLPLKLPAVQSASADPTPVAQ